MNITPEMARAELARRELQRRASVQNAPQKGTLASIGEDATNAGTSMLLGAGEKAMQLPGEAYESAQQFYQNPVSAPPRAAQNVLAGLLEGGKQVWNFPLNINTYLASKNIPPFKQTAGLAEKLKIGNTGLQHALLGEEKPGDQLWQDIGAIAPLVITPESISSKVPAATPKGLLNQLSKEKSKQLGIAKKDYNALFEDANKIGIKTVQPSKLVTKNQTEIIKNSVPKYHGSLQKYIQEPTIENAHWAQSELGALERHLESVLNRNGLTPSQIKTYKAVKETRNAIKKSMFSENSLGKNPGLAMRYDQLANKYKQNVIPYTGLQDLSEFEAGKLLPKTAVKNLGKNDEFMINLAKKHPGIFLHTPAASRLGWGALGFLGYDEIKKLVNSK